MSEPAFLSLPQIYGIHEQSVAEFGGIRGVRDEGLVASAAASAENAYVYGYGDLFDIAAAYAFHLSESQAFLDGNKRTGAGAALVFLHANGVESYLDPLLVYDLMMDLANRRLDKAGFAGALRNLAGDVKPE